MHCPRCRRPGLTSQDFYANRSKKDGLDTYCKVCAKARQRGAVVDPTKPPPTLVEAHQAATEQRDMRAEMRALVEENLSLKKQLTFVGGLKNGSGTDITRASEVGGEAVACAIFSDWHVEEPVEPGKVHGINEYNLTIAKSRSEHAFKNLLRLATIMSRDTKIDTIFLALLGDFFSNYIHEELREGNLLGPAPAAQFALERLGAGIQFLLDEGPFKLIIDCVPGNHGRMTLKPRIQNATETSLETFMYHSLAARFEGNPRVEFRVAESKMVYRRFFEKFNMRLIHGDDVKFGGGVGGVTIPIRKKLAAWDKAIRADLTVMGHFHQLMDGGDFIVNGSLIGYNEFAQAIGASPEEPRQSFFLIHNRNGGQKSIHAPIWLDDKHKEG